MQSESLFNAIFLKCITFKCLSSSEFYARDDVEIIHCMNTLNEFASLNYESNVRNTFPTPAGIEKLFNVLLRELTKLNLRTNMNIAMTGADQIQYLNILYLLLQYIEHAKKFYHKFITIIKSSQPLS